MYFLAKNEKNKLSEIFIDLAEIQSCKVISKGISTVNKVGNFNLTEKLELGSIPVDQRKPMISLEFFNTETNIQLIGEQQSIKKWNNLKNINKK